MLVWALSCSPLPLLHVFDGRTKCLARATKLPTRRKKANYFRLNVAFDGQEPALDDLQEMRRMEENRNRVANENELEIVESLVAKQFYFELEGAPRLIGGRYQCSGYLRYRFADKQQTILLNYFLSRSGVLALGDKEIAIFAAPSHGYEWSFPTWPSIFRKQPGRGICDFSNWENFKILSYQRISNDHDFLDA